MWRRAGYAAGGFVSASLCLGSRRTQAESCSKTDTCRRYDWQEARRLGHVDEIPDGLIRALQGDTCVAQVGAGISIPAGLPGFEGLLRGVAALSQVDLQLPENGSYDDLDGLQFQLAEQIGKDTMVELMRQMLFLEQPFPAAVQPTLNAFTNLPFAAVVSWNWDNLLDAHYMQVPNNSEGFEAVLQGVCRSSIKVARLLKMQGDLSDPATVRLTQQDYDCRQQEAIEFIRHLHQTYTILYVGLGFRSGGLDDTKRAGSLHYAILNDVTPEKRQELLELNIQAINYDSKGTSWRGNQVILEELAARSCHS